MNSLGIRLTLALSWLLLALNASAATPAVGKDALRTLVRLPSIAFQPNWSFDSERGFALGSSSEDISLKIKAIQKELRNDITDADAFLKLGDLCAANHDASAARKMWARAVALYRQRLELQADDPLLLAGLGRGLMGLGELREADSVLRKAVQIAPKEWRCRIALGRLLDAEARANIADSGAADVDSDNASPARISLAQRRLSEAGDSFDRAVTLAPEEAEVYFRRALHRSIRSTLTDAIRLAGGEQKDDVALQNNSFSSEALSDLQHASRLRARDYALIGGTVLYEVYTVAGRKGDINWGDFSWSSLPDKSQRSIRDALTRLENLGQDGDPQVAAGALEILGILQGSLLRETVSSVAALEHAVSLDPAREQAWEALVATLAHTGRYDELLAVCEDHLKQKETPRGHLLLAKAFEKLKQWDNSETEILTALRQEPNNFIANLSLAAVLLKRTRDSELLPQVDKWLGRAEHLLNEMPLAQRTQQQVIDLTLTRSIYFALSDQVEAARQWAQAVIKTDKTNKLAQDILTAMNY